MSTDAVSTDAVSTPELGDELITPDDIRLARIPIKFLGHLPHNVRHDLHLTERFTKSLGAELQQALYVVPIPEDYVRGEGEELHRFWVTKGNRRLAGAREAGLSDLLCLIDMRKAGDVAGQYLDQLAENDEEFRVGLTVWEQADALFGAHEAGATRARMRKVTGHSAAQIKAGIAAGKLSPQTRQAIQEMPHQWDLLDLELIAEFDGDQEALDRIQELTRWGRTVRYAVEYLRTERAEEAAYMALRAELSSTGLTVVDAQPDGSITLKRLTEHVEGFDVDAHADACAGHVVWIDKWAKDTPVPVCMMPEQHGYSQPVYDNVTPGKAAADSGPAQRIKIQGNRAWKAAAVVRHEWEAALLARSTAPKPVLAWVTRELLEMSAPLRTALPHATYGQLWHKLAGTITPDSAATARPGRLALMQLATIISAYEHEMTTTESSKATWRQDRQMGPCSREDAARLLGLLAELGYPAAPIERAVIDGTPYLGDAPIDQPDADAGVEADADQADQPDAEVDAEVDVETDANTGLDDVDAPLAA